MFLLRLVRRETQTSLTRLLVMAVLAGISSAMILAVINAGAQMAANGTASLRTAIIFILALVIYIKAQHYILSTSTIEIESAVHRLRVRLMNEVRHSELLSVDEIGRAEIYAGITKDTITLTQATTGLIFGAQSAVLILFTAIYIAYLSLPAFFLSAAIILLAAALYLARSRHLTLETQEALAWENRLFDRLTDLLDGFKEVRLSRPRSDDLFLDISAISERASRLKISARNGGLKQYVFSQTAFYVLLGGIVFVVPTFSQTLGDSMMRTTTALMFIIGSISAVLQSIPMLASANTAAEGIDRLEEKLRGTDVGATFEVREPLTRFETIEFSQVRFHYEDTRSETVFQVGPIDFTLRAGELVFVTGGNGSGKSTFLKLLAALYQPDTGEIRVDGERVTASTRDAYRGLISAVFFDYHLFPRLYGIPDPDPGEVKALLQEFVLASKTRITDGVFETLDLSAGQRKRVAFIVAQLEKRPLLLLDEWTADQDPDFRRKFYQQLLPELISAGVTLVVVTHDDRYLNELSIPCRRLRMDEGRFVGENVGRVS